MKIPLIILLAIWSLTSFAQHNWEKKTWDKESLGFGCSFGGQMTRPVLRMTGLLADRDFDEIRQLLNSKLTADQFLATYVLEALSEKKELQVNESEQKRINEIKNSTLTVPVCSGCTYWTELPLRTLFDNKSKGIIYVTADYWFADNYKSDSKRKTKAGP